MLWKCCPKPKWIQSLQHSPSGHSCSSSTPPIFLIFSPSILASIFEPHIQLRDLQNSVSGHKIYLAAVFILPAARCFMVRVIGRSHSFRGNGLKLIGTPVTCVGFSRYGKPNLETLEQIFEDRTKSRKAGRNDYYIHFEAMKKLCQ